MEEAWYDHVARGGEGSGGRIVQLRAARAARLLPVPPAIRTLPFVSKVAVCSRRGSVRSPVGVNVPGDCAMASGRVLATPNRSVLRRLLFIVSPLGRGNRRARCRCE